MHQTLTEKMRQSCGAHSWRLKYPVEIALLEQRKCRTQALKQLLSIPPEPIKPASRNWRLAYIIADLLACLQIKLS
jgi:hypothetical protein